jgi:C_GCAxxG_C_C family probable redox protein
MRRAETCGAVTGALMILGLRFGSDDAAAKADVYPMITEFQSRFESRCESVACRDLLGCDISTPEGMEHATGKNLFKTICPKMVETAAEILEEMC